MSGFKDVVGHKDIIQYIQNAVEQDKVSHAYILNGAKGSGKKMLAKLFAMTLQCENSQSEPCGECRSCRQADSGNQPDIITIQHEKPGSISVDDIREQLNGDIMIKPYSNRYKIYIIPEADLLTVQAQNALLKTIEEPPEYAIIFLLTENADSLLPTIRSRCVMLKLRNIKDTLIKKYLMEQLHIPDYQAEVDASFAQGNIGKAERIATSEEYAEVMENSLRLVKYAQNMELYELVGAIKGMTADKDNIQDYLDIFSMWFRDVLLFKATREVDTLVFRQEINYIKERAQKSSYEGLERIIDAIQTAGVRLKANVNFELTMELLFLTIKEN